MARPAYRNRRVGGRQTKLKRIGVVYDGQLTEDLYFRGWQQVLAQGRIKVIPSYVKSGGNPRIAVQEAVAALRRERDIHQMWCVTDVDDAPSQDVAVAMQEAQKWNIKLCLSNRCFEVWMLCHFHKSTKPIVNEADAVRGVGAYIPGYTDKNKAFDFGTLFELTKVALSNAEWLRHQATANPSTDVDKLVIELQKGLI